MSSSYRQRRFQVPHARGLCVMSMALFFCVLSPTFAAQSQIAPESNVKAAFLYKFISYIDWPATYGAEEPFKFGVLGAAAVEEELRALTANRKVDGRPIVVVTVQHASDLHGVQLLFVGKRATAKFAALAPEAEKQGIATVTEIDEGAARNSIINFVIVDGHVRFEISMPAAKRAGIRLSSRLLAVARNVEAEAR